MRQFVRSGPELPFEILQAQEEERLVFFCGSGVSYYTGLPDFRKLVAETFTACSHQLAESREVASTPEDIAFWEGRLDQAFHLLEQKVSRSVARRAALKILTVPPKKGTGTVRQHKALLDLAELRSGGFRLVTTNFDNRFELARPRANPIAEAPRVGWPRLDVWKHLTYLHGRISGSDDSGEDLVLSSGDFGRAYMTEGWAARFVVELFREYTVLFVGYSLNDPVLRYIVDGLATDMRDGRFRMPFVLAGYKNGSDAAIEDEWNSKGVTPIPFPTGPNGDDFSLQFETLVRWAEHSKGGLGTRISVLRDATNNDYVKVPEDLELKNVVWALSKSDGSVARAFADFDPPAKPSWLAPISEHLIPSSPNSEDVSLLALPSPPIRSRDREGHHVAPLAGYRAACIDALPMSPITFHLGRWLQRHRETRELVDWVIERGGIVHPNWGQLLSERLPDVSEPWRSFWSIVTSGMLATPCSTNDVQRFRRHFRGKKWPVFGDSMLLMATRARLTPKKAILFQDRKGSPTRLGDIAQFDLELVDTRIIAAVLKSAGDDEYREHLAALTDEITSRLVEALRMAAFAEITVAGPHNHISIPAIDGVPRNTQSDSWVNLVWLARVSFDCLNQTRPSEASKIATRWSGLGQSTEFQIFGRLAMYALSKIDALPSNEVAEFLLANSGRVLWDFSAWPEAANFIRTRMKDMTKKAQRRIISTVLEGPTRSTFPYFQGTDEKLAEIADILRKRRALAICGAGVEVPSSFSKLIEENEQADAASEERHQEVRFRPVAPKGAEALVDLSAEEIARQIRSEEGWDGGHRLADLLNRNLVLGLHVIELLAAAECSEELWEIGLDGLREAGRSHQSRKQILELVLRLARHTPDWLSISVLRPVARVLKSFGEVISERQGPTFICVWDLAWNASVDVQANDRNEIEDPVEEAINSPGGILAEAILEYFFSKKQTLGGGISDEFRDRFDAMWSGNTVANQHAQIILTSRLLWLHRVDPDWVKAKLIPALCEGEGRTDLWAAFLWLGQWDIELAAELENGFQKLIPHLVGGPEPLSERVSEWFATVLMNAPDLFSKPTKQRFFQYADPRALVTVAWVIENSLEDAKEKAGELWQLRIRSILVKFWPADRDKLTQEVSARLVSMAMACRDEFPDALDKLADKNLVVAGAAENLLWSLGDDDTKEYDIVARHPEVVLKTMRLGLGNRPDGFLRGDLSGILDRIERAAPDLRQDLEFVRLREIAARG